MFDAIYTLLRVVGMFYGIVASTVWKSNTVQITAKC